MRRVVVIVALVGCAPEAPWPTLMVTPDHKDPLLARLDAEPWATLLDRIRDRAAQEPVDPTGPWDPAKNGQNAEIAQANAFLAWLLDDEAAATKARSLLPMLATDFDTTEVIDVNIRMPDPLMGYTNAVDLLRGTEWLTAEEDADAEARITEVASAFYQWTLGPGVAWLRPAQNNHPIRTAAALGYVGLAFPDHPQADLWLDFATSELDYLWGPDGRYVQADGGVSEGPFYYGFAMGVSVAFFIAMHNASDPDRTFTRDCSNRNDQAPWTGHGCVPGEAFTFANPLFGAELPGSADWSVALALPWGQRPPLADANFNPLNGHALLSSFGGAGHTVWDWEHNRDRPLETTWGAELTPHHLVYVDPEVPVHPPEWTTRFFPAGGNAVFRSAWDDDAVWGLLVAEAGPARMTLHDHVDGTSFTVAAHGEYLLIDPGYYKPNELNNAVTSAAGSHNVILVDGQGAPDKGLLTNFGDADAFIDNTWDGAHVDYAEAHQTYEQTRIERSMVFVDDALFVIADRLQTTASEPRDHTWRLHGWGGYDGGGTFTLDADGATWVRDRAGVQVRVRSTAGAVDPREPPFVELHSPHVHQFDNDRTVAHHGVLDAHITALEPDFLAVILPYRTEDEPAAATPVSGATAWWIEAPDGPVLAWLRAPGDPTSLVVGGSTVETDAELVVARWSDPAFAAVARGVSLRVDGVEIASGPGPLFVTE